MTTLDELLYVDGVRMKVSLARCEYSEWQAGSHTHPATEIHHRRASRWAHRSAEHVTEGWPIIDPRRDPWRIWARKIWRDWEQSSLRYGSIQICPCPVLVKFSESGLCPNRVRYDEDRSRWEIRGDEKREDLSGAARTRVGSPSGCCRFRLAT